MVGILRPHCLFASETERRRRANEMNLRKRETHGNSHQHKGWMAGRIYPLPPVVGEVFFLTSPFIERGYRRSEIGPTLNIAYAIQQASLMSELS